MIQRRRGPSHDEKMQRMKADHSGHRWECSLKLLPWNLMDHEVRVEGTTPPSPDRPSTEGGHAGCAVEMKFPTKGWETVLLLACTTVG